MIPVLILPSLPASQNIPQIPDMLPDNVTASPSNKGTSPGNPDEALATNTASFLHDGMPHLSSFLLARLESAYSLIWGSHKIWGKGGGDTLDLL